MRRSLAVAVVMLLTLTIAGPALARPAGAAGKGVYIVVMEQAPAVAYTGGVKGLKATAPNAGAKLNPTSANVKRYVAYLKTQHANAMKAVGADVKNKFYDYSYSINGFAAVLTRGQAAKMASLSGVWFVERDRLRPELTDNSPDFLGLTDSGGLWDDLGGQGSAGEDVIVGVIDTGIWPEHPSFSDQSDLADRPGESGKAMRVYDAPPATWHGICQSGERWSQDDCNNKLIGARYFLAGFRKNGIIPADYKSARDKDGHGTHTSSTAAGNANVPASIFGRPFGTVSGIAPRARIAMYKALWNDQGGFGSDLAAAIDAAVADGVDVINYSVGGASTSFLTADAVSFLFAQRAGVFAAVSAGNSGPGAQTIGNPAVAPWVTTVGASTQDRTFQATATFGALAPITGASVTEAVSSHKLVDSATSGSELCIVGALNPAVVSGNIVLCKRGSNARVDKSLAVKQAGGLGMILYNDVSDAQALVTDNHWVPSVHIKKSDGEAIKAYITANPLTATAAISASVNVSAQGSVMADFSSRGPQGGSADVIKPDVTAPGVNILAGNSPTAFAGRPGQLFQSISGTSMSAPHVAGIAALLVDAHPTWTPSMIKSSLMTTGRQNVEKENGTTDADPFDMGGGHVVPNDATNPGLAYNTTFDNYRAFLRSQGLCTNCFGTSPAAVIDPSDLNIPSIAIADLIGSQTVTRTVTDMTASAGTWTFSASVPGYTVNTPASLNVTANGTATYQVEFVRNGAPLDTWAFGHVTLTKGGLTVRTPVALRAKILSAPPTFTPPLTPPATTHPASGTATWNVKVGYTGTLSATAYGAVADNALAGEVVSQDPDQDPGTDTFTSGVKLYDFNLAAGTQYWAGGTFATTTEAGSDLDVFLLRELENGTAGFQYPGDVVASSADGDSEEIVELRHPAAGSYRLIIHGWGTPDGASTYTLHRWLVNGAGDPAGFEAHVGAGPDPASVTTGQTYAINLTWSGLSTAGVQYRGLVNYDNGTVIGSTAVIINR